MEDDFGIAPAISLAKSVETAERRASTTVHQANVG